MAEVGKKGKTYGLILPKAQKTTATPLLSKPSIFDDDSAEEDSKELLGPVSSALLQKQKYESKLKIQTQLEIDRVLAEDPTCYEYDSLYDDLQKDKQKNDVKVAVKVDKKPKYIKGLLKASEQRKREYERRIERTVQKERQNEGDEFVDKESFVTSAYKEKMEQIKAEEERAKREEERETILDVTKQKDMSGFYRYLYKETTSKPEDTSHENVDDAETNDAEKKLPTSSRSSSSSDSDASNSSSDSDRKRQPNKGKKHKKTSLSVGKSRHKSKLTKHKDESPKKRSDTSEDEMISRSKNQGLVSTDSGSSSANQQSFSRKLETSSDAKENLKSHKHRSRSRSREKYCNSTSKIQENSGRTSHDNTKQVYYNSATYRDRVKRRSRSRSNDEKDKSYQRHGRPVNRKSRSQTPEVGNRKSAGKKHRSRTPEDSERHKRIKNISPKRQDDKVARHRSRSRSPNTKQSRSKRSRSPRDKRKQEKREKAGEHLVETVTDDKYGTEKQNVSKNRTPDETDNKMYDRKTNDMEVDAARAKYLARKAARHNVAPVISTEDD